MLSSLQGGRGLIAPYGSATVTESTCLSQFDVVSKWLDIQSFIAYYNQLSNYSIIYKGAGKYGRR